MFGAHLPAMVTRRLAATLMALAALPAFGQVADLVIAKSGPSVVDNGTVITYTLSIRNNGPSAANGATFSDTLPAGLSAVTAACGSPVGGAVCPASVSVTASTVSGTIPTLPAGGSVLITINATVPVGSNQTTLPNTATVSPPAGITESNPSSNSSTISTAINFRQASIAVTKIATAASATVGTPITYSVTYTNLGPGPASGLAVRDRLQTVATGTGQNGGFTFAAASLACAASGGAACPASLPVTASSTIGTALTTMWSLSVPTLPAGGSVTFTYQLTPTGIPPTVCGYSALTVRNIGDYTALPTNVTDPIAADNSSTVNLPLSGALIPPCPQADIRVTKTQSLSPVVFGSVQTYSVTYTNLGPGAANGTTITDVISSVVAAAGSGFGGNLSYVGGSVVCTSLAGAVCPALSFPAAGTLATAGTTAINAAAIPTFPAGSSITITLTLTPTAFAAGTCGYTSATLQNNARVAAMPTGVLDPVAGNNSVTVSANLPARPACPVADLQISKVPSSATLTAGAPITYTVTVTNPATSIPVTNALLTDTLAVIAGTGSGTATLSYTGASFGACTSTGGAVCPTLPVIAASGSQTTTATTLINNLVIPSLPAGSSVSFALTLTPTTISNTCSRTANQLRNSAVITTPGGTLDANSANNTALANVAYSCLDLALSKSVSPASVSAGDTVTFTIDVANSGPGAGDGAVLSDPLPGGFIYGSASCTVQSGAAVCGSVSVGGGGTLTSTIPTLPASSSVRYTVIGTATNTSSTWANTATVAAPPGTFDRLPASNNSTVSFTVLTSDPTLTKTALTPNVAPGSRVRYQLVIANPAIGSTLTGLTVTDTLPAGFNYNNTVSVVLSGGATRPSTSNPSAGSTSPVWGTFTLPAGGSVIISFEADTSTSLSCGALINNSFTANYSAGAVARSATYNGADPGLPGDDVTLRCPAIGLAKRLAGSTDNGDGTVSIAYEVFVRNAGNEALNAVSINDALSTAAGGSFGTRIASGTPGAGQYRVSVAPSFSTACTLALAPAYNGDTGAIALASGTLPAAESCTIQFTLLMAPSAGTSLYNNQASGSGSGALSGAGPVSDLSDDGANPDPASTNGSGGVNDATPVTINQVAAVAVSKSNSASTLVADQSTTYLITLSNAGPSGVLGTTLRDPAVAGLTGCSVGACTVTAGVAQCPAVGAGAGQLSIANLQGAGVTIPRLNSGSTLTIALTCTVSATGN